MRRLNNKGFIAFTLCNIGILSWYAILGLAILIGGIRTDEHKTPLPERPAITQFGPGVDLGIKTRRELIEAAEPEIVEETSAPTTNFTHR